MQLITSTQQHYKHKISFGNSNMTTETADLPSFHQPNKPEQLTSNDDSSCDTQDALLDMLGLSVDDDNNNKNNDSDAPSARTPPLSFVLRMDEDEEVEVEVEVDVNVNPAVDHRDCHGHRRNFTTVPLCLPPMCSRYGLPSHRCMAVALDHFWTPTECDDVLTKARRNGFEYITEASHTAPDGSTYRVQLQNPNPHKLSVFCDDAVLQKLWHRLQHFVIPGWKDDECWQQFQQRYGPPLGLNPRLRVLQYDANDDDKFDPHFDATTRVGENNNISRITVLLYLNDGGGNDFEGGETLYLNSHISICNTASKNNANAETGLRITPRTGKLVMFEHDLFHAGAPLKWGRKHVLRTDILFRGDKDESKKGSEKVPPIDADLVVSAQTKPPLIKDFVPVTWSTDQHQILQDMGLWSMTLEAFLVPGESMLMELLIDGGLEEGHVLELLKVVHGHLATQQKQLYEYGT